MYCWVSSSSRPGHVGVDHPAGEADGDAEDQQHAADRRRALGGDAAHVAADLQVAVDDDLGEEGVERADRRRFHRGGEAAEQRADDHDRQRDLPFGVPQRRRRLAGRERWPVDVLVDGGADAPAGGHADEQQAGQDAADEQVLDRRLGDDAVEDERQRRRQQQPQRARRGEQPERELLAVAVLHQRREQQPAERENRHPRAAGEHREERAQQRADHRGAAGKPAEEGAEDPQQPERRAALGQQHADQREERNRGQRRLGRELVGLDQDGRGRHVLGQEHDRRGAAEQREDRRAGHRARRRAPAATRCRSRALPAAASAVPPPLSTGENGSAQLKGSPAPR